MEHLNPHSTSTQSDHLASRERKLAVCEGTVPLSPADQLELLTVLADDPDEIVAQRANEALMAQPLESFFQALKSVTVLPSVFAYAAKSLADKPGISDTLVENKNCPAEFLIPVIPHLSASGVQSLAGDLYRVSDSQDLIAALHSSTLLNAENRMLMSELLGSSIDQGVLAEAALEAEPDADKRQTLLQRLAIMTVAQRVQFAIKGGSEARRTLIRDSNKVVQRAVLQSPRLSDQEVEAFASMSSLTDEILRQIANNRSFRKNYTVVRNLLNNPKTPLDVSLHLLPMINVMDLKRLTTNKNIPETLRASSVKLQRQRQDVNK